MPFVLGLFQRRADMDRKMRLANLARLRALKAAHGAEVEIVNSHDPACGGEAVAKTARRNDN
jgi:hypothetical protein